MTPKELAQKVKITPRMALYILQGKQRPSAKLAVLLEQETGTSREAWMWPERYHNPYIK